MGISDWFKPKDKEAATPAPAALPATDAGAEVGGLNFKSAVDAHMKWKIRLESYINGTSTEDLKVDVVCRDDQCPLGKWIYSRGGTEFGYSETFFDMKVHHANFHRCAGEVLSQAQSGHKQQALDLLQRGEYVRASERVKKMLAKLFVLVADGKTAIDSHLRWKERLRDYITGHSAEALSMETVGRDDLCTLGLWLKSEGETHYGGTPVLEALRATHKRFHACAGEVLAMAGAGKREEALSLLDDPYGPYAKASDEVTAAIVDLFAKRA